MIEKWIAQEVAQVKRGKEAGELVGILSVIREFQLCKYHQSPENSKHANRIWTAYHDLRQVISELELAEEEAEKEEEDKGSVLDNPRLCYSEQGDDSDDE